MVLSQSERAWFLVYVINENDAPLRSKKAAECTGLRLMHSLAALLDLKRASFSYRTYLLCK